MTNPLRLALLLGLLAGTACDPVEDCYYRTLNQLTHVDHEQPDLAAIITECERLNAILDARNRKGK